MKRFLVFSGYFHDTTGGWNDYVGTFETVDEARAAAKNANDQWWHIVDTQTLSVVEES